MCHSVGGGVVNLGYDSLEWKKRVDSWHLNGAEPKNSVSGAEWLKYEHFPAVLFLSVW